MEIKIEYQSTFKKDLALMVKRGKKEKIFKKVLELLIRNLESGTEIHFSLPAKHRIHKMLGNYTGFWDCHIENDWVLIFSFENNILKLIKTCAHADFLR